MRKPGALRDPMTASENVELWHLRSGESHGVTPSQGPPQPLLLMELVRLWLPQGNKHRLCIFVGVKGNPGSWQLGSEHKRQGSEQGRVSSFLLFGYPSAPTSQSHLRKMIDPNGLFKTYCFQQCKLKAILGKKLCLYCGPMRGGGDPAAPCCSSLPTSGSVLPPSLPIQSEFE